MQVPGSPTGVSQIVGDGFAVVRWSAPENNGGSPVTGYTVTSSPGGFTATTAAGVTEAAVFGLTNGVDYTFSVVARNAEGTSDISGETFPLPPSEGASSADSFGIDFTNLTIAWWWVSLALILASALVALLSVFLRRRNPESSIRSDTRPVPHTAG